jgi:hypothetical protein
VREFLESPSRILVYQMGKVGSQTISRTLEQNGLGKSVIHTHTLSKHLDDEIAAWQRIRNGATPLPTALQTSIVLRNDLSRGEPYRVVTGVRDPIAREISAAFENPFEYGLMEFENVPDRLRTYPGQMPAVRSLIDGDVALHVLTEKLKRQDTYDYALNWFDREIKGILGVDVFQYPFDTEAGWAIIEGDECEILIACVERLNELIPTVVSDFVGAASKLDPHPTNIRVRTTGADAYRHVLRNIHVDRETCDYIYSTRFVRHFYDDSTIQAWTRRWTGI